MHTEPAETLLLVQTAFAVQMQISYIGVADY